MGAGGKEVSLDVFETHLKKLLHIIDKLPKVSIYYEDFTSDWEIDWYYVNIFYFFCEGD